MLSSLTAISPIDGRYHNKTEGLHVYFSEYALMHYRVRVEVEYFIALCEANIKPLPLLTAAQKAALKDVYLKFDEKDAATIKQTERTTNHDVKAVEYFMKAKLAAIGLNEYTEFIHFGLTSQDINNTAIPLSIKEAVQAAILPCINRLTGSIYNRAKELEETPMLAHTHGQPASPTGLGKEIMVFYERLQKQIKVLSEISYEAKFGGATGNFNAHNAAYPDTDWIAFANKFVNNNLGLSRQQFTTQIEHYDGLAQLFDCLRRINVILVDFSRDVWQYISLDYFKQQIVAGEVGSSAMPHKVNPIDFENAEGNLLMANALFDFLANKLPISRLQRDLTDSTVLRNVGVPFAHSLIAYESLLKGIGKLLPNKSAIADDLEDNWAVVAEGIQTILRREQFPKPYEALKALTRTNAHITKESMHEFIDTLPVSDSVKAELKKLSPTNYTGYALKWNKIGM